MFAVLSLARPDGYAFRETLGESVRLVTTFDKASPVEAISETFSMYGCAERLVAYPSDDNPYPKVWQARQKTDC